MQVLVVGKISQAAILAAAAYRNHETFKLQTGITNSRLIYDREHHDTKVCHFMGFMTSWVFNYASSGFDLNIADVHWQHQFYYL